MKSSVLLALFLVVALAAVAHCYEPDETPSFHDLMKRQTKPGCTVWECSESCRTRGHVGGYCDAKGCTCF